MRQINRAISWGLVLCVMMTFLPGIATAQETELVNIRVSDGHTENFYRVLFQNSDIYFSAEDFGRITRYTFTESANYGYQLGRKIIVVNPNNGDINIPVLHYTGNIGEVIMVDGTTYLSASQMLPWMNVTCRVENGILTVIPDKISLWQIVDDFSYDDYMFNLYSEYGDSISSIAGLSAMIVFDGIINLRFDRLIPSDENGSVYNYECYVQALADAGPNFVTEGVLEDIEKYVDVSKGLDPFVEYLGVKLEGGLNNLGDYLSDLGIEEIKIQEILKISDTWEEIRQCVSVPGVITEYYNIFEAFKTYELIIGTDNEYREYLEWLSERGTGNTTFDRALDEAQILLDENKGVTTTLVSEFTDKLLEDTFLVVPGEVFQAIANNAIDDATITRYAGLASGFEYINSWKAYIEVSKAIFTLAFPEMIKGYEGIAKAAPLETIQDYCWLLAGSLQNEELTEETIVHIRQSYLTALKTSRQLFEAEQNTMNFGIFADEKIPIIGGLLENGDYLLESQMDLINMKIQQLIASADSTQNDSVEGKQEYTDKLKAIFADSKFVDSMLVASLITIIEAKCTCGLDEYGGDSNNPWLFEIPQINLESDGINEINQGIMSKYSSLIHDCTQSDPYDYPSYSSVECEYSVSGDILSLVIKAPSSDCDVVDYDVYNISIKNKCAVSKDVVIAEAGMPVDEYRSHVKYVLGSEFWDNYVFLNGDATEELPLEYLFSIEQTLQDTISPTNIDAARPFIASDGSLCIVGRFFFVAGGGEFDGIYNLEDYEISPYYSETLDYQKPEELMRIEMSWDGTDENGNLMYLNVDFSGTMDDGSWVQINDWSFTYDEQGQPIARCERNQSEGTITYYLYKVDGLINYVVSVDVGTSDYFSMIGDSGVKAVVTYPDGKTYNYTLDEGVYKGSTGYWYWAPFRIDHGTLAEYNAS